MPAAHRASTLSEPPLESEGGPAEPSHAAQEAGLDQESPSAGLSNDYLNPYSEALMLIELAAGDPAIAADLAEWRPIGYRAYFSTSPLRRAPAALAAYDALQEERRQAFEELTRAMDRLALAAATALQPPCAIEDAALIAEVTAPAFRRLIDRAASFLNSGGEDLARDGEVADAQAVIDRLIDRTANA